MVQAVEISPVGQPTIEIVSLFPKQGEWTEADYFRLPETNRIIELSEGRLIISPSPTEQHQETVANIFFMLRNYLLKHNIGKALTAPMDTKLKKGIVRQPDIIFMSNEHLHRNTNKHWGIPDLAIEVTSHGTKREDRKDKYNEYEKAGIKEYWIVDPDKQAIEVFTLENKVYKIFGKWGSGEIAKSKLLDGFEVSVDEIMA
ncbi:MAG: Uma2 family endonuclease [Candidatus Poribacteria bacterium]